jgi:4-hydroxybenzoate-CoA ligase
MNIVQLICEQAQTTPKAPALRYGAGQFVNFEQFLVLVQRAATLLSTHAPGSHVGFLMRDTVLQVAMRIASMQVGVIAVPLTNRIPPPEFDKRANLFALQAVYADGDYTEHLGTRTVIRVDDIAMLPTEQYTEYRTHDQDRMCLAWSGGTHGTPDGLYYSHSSMKAFTDVLDSQWGAGADKEIFYPVVPQLSGAATIYTVMSLVHGHSIIIEAQPFSPAVVANNVIDHAVTHLMGTSPVFKTILRRGVLPKANLPRLCVASGDAVSVQIQREWQEHYGSKLVVAIASSQIGVFAEQKPHHPLTSVGEQWPGFEVRLLDDNGNHVADGEVGQLWVRTEARAVADVAANGSTSFGFDGWITTNDMMIRKDGVYYMVGRKNDTFKVNGQFVSVLKVEDLVRDIPGVADAVAVPDFDDAGLPRVKVYVVTQQGTVDQQQITHAVIHLHEDLYSHERPRSVEFIEEIPRHPGSMKVQRFRLNPLYKQAMAT